MNVLTTEQFNALSIFLNLNIFYFNNKTLIQKSNSNFNFAHQFLNKDIDNNLEYVNVKTVSDFEIIENQYKEKYMVYILDDSNIILAGPFSFSSFDIGYMREFLRNKKIPLAISKVFLKHYSNIPIKSRRFCNALFALFGEMFFSNKVLPFHKNAVIEDSNTMKILKDEIEITKSYHETIRETRKDFRVRSPVQLENKLHYHIEKGDWNKSFEVLQNINSLDSAVFLSDSVQSKKYSLVAGCSLYTRAIIRGGIDYIEAFALSDAIIKTIHATNSIKTLTEFEYQMVQVFCNRIKNNSSKEYSIPVQKTIEYIKENLTSKITLKNISDAVYLHPNYISNLFKKEVHLTIMNFVQKQRIEESKMHLISSNESIASISNYYQFCNEAYFIKVFKKFENTTPNQFRLKTTNITTFDLNYN